MLLQHLYETPDRYRGRLIMQHYVGRNGTPIAPEHVDIVKKHVKKLSNPRGAFDHVVNQYNDDWYWHTNLGKDITSFDDLKNILSKYYTFGSSKAMGESNTKHFESLEFEFLGEIKMSPKHLRAEAAKTGAIAGMEFEMIVPGISGGDNDYPEMVQDYSNDPRTRSISDIVEFFNDGDYNSRRQLNGLEQNLVISYAEWVDEQFEDRWAADKTEMVYEFVRYELDPEITAEILGFDADNRPDGFTRAQLDQVTDIIADDPQNAWHDEAKDYARDSFQENADQSDWLDEVGMEHMSDVVDQYDIQWPYWEQEETDSAGVDIDSVARDFSDAVGRPVNASRSYHGARREPGHYVVEPDGSLSPDSDDDMGMEFVSPPLPIDEMLDQLKKVREWAGRNGCYTNRSTGLHINVSVPEFDSTNLDYVKLALLLGDEYVLSQFGRSSNTYAKSAMSIVRDRVRSNPDTARELLNKMRSHMEDLATKAIHSGDTSKYTSINTKTGYIEFRSPGGDWLDENFDKIETTLLRFTVALKAAMNPEAYREEYLKKLYKLLEPTAVEGAGDTIKYFAEYVAGKLPQTALRSFVKQARLKRDIAQGKGKGLQYWWRVYKDGKDAPNTAVIEVVAVDKKEAIDRAGAEWGVFSQEYKSRMDAEPVRPYKEGQDQPGTVIPQDQQGNTQWRILINGQEIHRFWNRPNQGEANAAAIAWVRDQIRRGLLSQDQVSEIEIVPVTGNRT